MKNLPPNVEIVADTDEMSRVAAVKIIEIAARAIAERGVLTIAPSGGSTPKKLYALLADEAEPFRADFPWRQTHFFFGDERNVPPDDAESNYRMANETLFSKIPDLPLENVHRVLAEQNAADAAADYEQELRVFFQQETPRFDLILLGMGDDGHTASLFPESPALDEKIRFFIENWVEKFSAYRLTMTLPTINNARQIMFLIGGAEKAAVVGEIFKADSDELKFPAQMVRPINGKLLWLFDQSAAAEIS